MVLRDEWHAIAASARNIAAVQGAFVVVLFVAGVLFGEQTVDPAFIFSFASVGGGHVAFSLLYVLTFLAVFVLCRLPFDARSR